MFHFHFHKFGVGLKVIYGDYIQYCLGGDFEREWN